MSTILVCLICGLFVIWLGINGKLSSISILCNGFINKFIIDIAKTPDGAFAIYSEAIDKQVEQCLSIKNIFANVCGELEVLKKDLLINEEQSKKFENDLKIMINSGYDENNDELILIAERKLQFDKQIEVDKKIKIYLDNKVNEIKNALSIAEKKVLKLKDERKHVVNELKRNKRLETVYNAAENITSDEGFEKMILSIRDGLKESTIKAVGSQVAHENSLSAKINNSEKVINNTNTINYLKSIILQTKGK